MLNETNDHFFGFGPLDEYLSDPDITEIMVNGPGKIYVEKKGRLQLTEHTFQNAKQVLNVIDRIVGKAGKRVDYATPLCDARLPDGCRANVVLPPVSLQGPVLTIRRFQKSLLHMNDLIKLGSLQPCQADELKKLIQERKNIVIAGNSGSGKTTLLNILSKEIDSSERILALEDTSELQLQQPHVIRFETRQRNQEGKGEITMKDLVINALRMRPDRIIVGECRGDEVIPMLQAMNTGHDGSMTTLHANTAEDVMPRLEGMILMGAPNWPIDVVRHQIKTALDVVVYLKREGTRRWIQDIRSC